MWCITFSCIFIGTGAIAGSSVFQEAKHIFIDERNSPYQAYITNIFFFAYKLLLYYFYYDSVFINLSNNQHITRKYDHSFEVVQQQQRVLLWVSPQVTL